MKRNRNVDLLRAAAILCIIVYHCYVLSGYPWASHLRLNMILGFGGEIGVTLFFLLSGYGIYCSMSYREEQGRLPAWGAFMKQRCLRVMPQYYACVTILLFFCSTYLLSKSGIWHVIAYYTFTENFTPATHASINGALWTMGVIFQFYLIALFLYKMVRKNWLLASLGAIIFTVLCKAAVYHWLPKPLAAETNMYFVYGRQLFTALDNFVLGMTAAVLWKKAPGHGGENRTRVTGLILAFAAAAGIFAWAFYYGGHGLYGDSVSAYAGHTILALLLFVLVYGMSVTWQISGKIFEPFGFVAKYQYGIYLWHMPIIMNLQASSEFFGMLSKDYFAVFMCIMVLLACLAGFWSTKWVDSIDYTKLFQRKKQKPVV